MPPNFTEAAAANNATSVPPLPHDTAALISTPVSSFQWATSPPSGSGTSRISPLNSSRSSVRAPRAALGSPSSPSVICSRKSGGARQQGADPHRGQCATGRLGQLAALGLGAVDRRLDLVGRHIRVALAQSVSQTLDPGAELREFPRHLNRARLQYTRLLRVVLLHLPRHEGDALRRQQLVTDRVHQDMLRPISADAHAIRASSPISVTAAGVPEASIQNVVSIANIAYQQPREQELRPAARLQSWVAGSGPHAATVRPVPKTVAACGPEDRKSTRLNSSHSQISYAVF